VISLQPKYLDKAKNPVEGFGRKVFELVDCSGQALLVMLEAFYWFKHIHKRRSEVSRQLFSVGLMSFGVVSIVALFTGMILSLQTGQMLRDFGQEANVGIVVSQTMCREMGPFMTALIVAASVGSAMAAELGTMRVSEEIDALEVMSINPVRYLVMPRLVAMLIMTPILTIYSDFIGIVGGGLVAYTKLEVSWANYYQNVLSFLKLKEIYVGIFKACVFGVIIATVSCYQGLSTTNGAVGVGRATRKAVVTCFLLVLIIGYFLTSLFYG
jgi:phospholipid/cholesterol/gamma-HCH transport system permease protein